MQISARPSWYTWDAPQNLFGIYSYTCFGFHVSRFKFRPSMLLACMLLSHLSSNKNPHSWKIDKNRCYSVIPPAKTAEGSTQRWCMLTGYWLLKWQVDLIHGPYSCILPPILYSIFGTCIHSSIGALNDVRCGHWVCFLFPGCLSSLGMRCLNASKFDWGKWRQFVFWTGAFPADGRVALIIKGWKRIFTRNFQNASERDWGITPEGFVFPSPSQQSG